MKKNSSSVRFGIVGSGMMARVFANAFKDDTKNTRMVGVTLGRRAPGFAEEFGIKHFPTYEDMLVSPDIDAVVLATPHSVHLPESLAAAKAGKHIFLEKPMALTTAECRQMVDAAKAAGVFITVGQVTRRMEAPRLARTMIDNGDIGDVRMVQTWRGMVGGLTLPPDEDKRLAVTGRAPGFPPGTWAKDPAEGGPFLDWGSHGCDITRWYAGADPVLAFGQFAKYDKRETLLPSAMAQYTFANGVMGHIWMTYELPHGALGTRARYLVIGSKGMLDVHAYGQVKRSRADGNWDIAYQSEDFKGPDAGWGYPSPYMRQAFARQIQALTNAIADGTPMDVSGIDGLRAVEMAEAAKRSAATGESVRLPLA